MPIRSRRPLPKLFSMTKRISGLVAAPFTPFHSDGSLWLDQIAPYARHLARHAVSGAFVCGTTGEGASLTLEERKRVAERWKAEAPAGLKVIVHVGGNCMADCRELARHAQEIGADAVAAIAPHFFRPANLDELVAWCGGLAAAAPELPFYYYHMPAMSGVNFEMAQFLPRAAERISNFGGIKFTHENLMDYALTVAAAAGRFDVLFGRDEILLSALALGATGAVGSTYNYAAPLYQRMMAAHEQGDRAAALAAQLESARLIQAFVKHGGMAANKAIMRLIGVDCGPVRPPLSRTSPDEEAALKRDLERLGWLI